MKNRFRDVFRDEIRIIVIKGCLLGIVACLFTFQIASGAPAFPDQARAAVNGWLQRQSRHLGTALGQQIEEVITFKDNRGNSLYHIVYLKPNGFVIVSADDCIEPIIAFAASGVYDPSPDNPLGALVGNDLRGRMAVLREEQEPGQKHNGDASAPVGRFEKARKKWNLLWKSAEHSLEELDRDGTKTGIGSISDVRVAPLVESRWSQHNVSGSPCYNYYTPNNYYCGCVATAMAQLIRYFQRPITGVGTNAFSILVNGVAEQRNLRGGDGVGGPYVWTNMVLIPGSSITEPQRQAIGALCHDAGVSVNMSYTSSGSGSSTMSTADSLVNTFGFGNAVAGFLWDFGPGLIGMLNPNLDAGIPTLLGISRSGGGHSVVCDGYGYDSSTLYHHINLGWGGTADAWYNLPDVDTGSYNYTSVDSCVYNVYTNGTGEIISGRITNTSGDPIGGVTVTAEKSGGGTYTATSNTNGIYAVVKLPSSSQYTLSASKNGYSFTNATVSTGTSQFGDETSGNQWGIDFLGTSSGEYTLDVISVQGMANPPAGQHTYPDGTSLTCSVTNSPVNNGTTQYMCVGWTGAGSVPIPGMGTNTGSFYLTNVSTITWNWQTNYWLDTGTNGSGTINVADGWIRSGSNVVITATADDYYHFSSWSGNTNGCSIDSNEITVLGMDQPWQIVGQFGEDLAPMGTPEWWLALHGLTNDTFDVEETNDWDGDGMLAWEEWVAGTDPTNASSSLRITDVSRAANGRSPISFTSVSGKIYRIAVTTNLLPDNWWGSEYATTEDGGFQINAITGTAETTTIYVEPSGIPQFYRVEVQ